MDGDTECSVVCGVRLCR